jgi:hypothetical protein
MTTNHYDWAEAFHACYDKAVELYRLGERQPSKCFDKRETSFLASIGHTPQELYDYAEDWVCDETPSFHTALLIAAVRRDYFLVIQKGQLSTHKMKMSDFPAKDAEMDGFRWLPRIILKARAKLRGELPADLMYGCGGDRAFLRSVNIHPADFLRTVWSARDDNRKIIGYVQQRHAAKA